MNASGGTPDEGDALMILLESLGIMLPKAMASACANFAQINLGQPIFYDDGYLRIPIRDAARNEIGAAGLTLRYDVKMLTPVAVEPGQSNSNLLSNLVKPGEFRISMINSKRLADATGALAVVDFRLTNPNQSDTKVKIEQMRCFSCFGNAMIVTIADGNQILENSPQSWALHFNCPNPFTPVTTITFTAPESVDISLAVYNTKGQLVRKLLDGSITGGTHHVLWNCTEEAGVVAPAGIYFCVIKEKFGAYTKTVKMTLLK